MHLRGDKPRRMPKQYAPVKFGDPFNPNSVEGHHVKLADRREDQDLARKQTETQSEKLESRSLLKRLWHALRGR